jgi:uncharacterized membrane protein
MSKKFEAKSEQSLKSKREQFLEANQKQSRTKLFAIVALIAFLGVAGYFAIRGIGGNQASVTTAKSNPSGVDTPVIKIPLAEINSGKAKFFDYKLTNNTPVRFFALKSSDGLYRAAMDACDVCYHAKKGYKQEGEYMVCNNCGQKFHSNLINEVKGGCNPVGLASMVEGDQLVVKTSDIENRGSYFR